MGNLVTQDQPAPKAPASKQLVLPRWLWQGRFGPPFWTITGVISLVVNVILVAVLVGVGRELFTIKTLVADLVGGLHSNFVKMDAARIETTINVNTQIPVVFDLPVKTNTIVVLTADTTIDGARVNLVTGGLSIISAPTSITLPAGTQLPIALDIVVPVSTKIPVKIPVKVSIPLDETDLHEPFVGLQNVINPYRVLLNGLPGSWDTVFCQQGMKSRCPEQGTR